MGERGGGAWARFLEAMRDADIVRKHKNLVYVQALKWMQAASGQAGGRKEVADKAKKAGEAEKNAAQTEERALYGAVRELHEERPREG